MTDVLILGELLTPIAVHSVIIKFISCLGSSFFSQGGMNIYNYFNALYPISLNNYLRRLEAI